MPRLRPTVASRQAAVAEADDQRLRSSLILSCVFHASVLVLVVLGPVLLPTDIVVPQIMQVQLLSAESRAPEPLPLRPQPPVPQPEADPPAEDPLPEPEPAQSVETEPEPISRSIEEIRLEQQRERERELEAERVRAEEAEKRRRDEAERRRREEEARQRREEEERERREEEERQAPQVASRRKTPDPTPERQTARRSGIDFTGTEANQSGFTVEDFPFSDYVHRIRDMVGLRWEATIGKREAAVFFRIGRSGQLAVRPQVVQGSRDNVFDQAALRAVLAAAPFPPLPAEYRGQSLGVRFAFRQE